MDAVREFLDMGGYAVFVWPSYAITFLVMGGLVYMTLRRFQARKRALAALEGERPGGRGRARRARGCELNDGKAG